MATVAHEAIRERLRGRVALITGSGQGIGRCEALFMAREGAHVIVNDIGDDDGVSRAERVVAEIRDAGGQASASLDDISTLSGAQSAVAAAVERYGGLDILVNNAGLRAAGHVDELSEADWTRVIDSHLKATFATTKFAVPVFRARGAGLIINTGSEAGMGMPFNAAYAAAKEGIAGFSRTIARELGYEHIRCNMILPRATIGTGGGQWGRGKYTQHLPVLAALGRYWLGNRGHTLQLNTPSRPEQVAEFVTWLCTDAAGQINGTTFFVSGEEIGLVSEPEVFRSILRPGDWTADIVDTISRSLTFDLSNRFLVDIAGRSESVRDGAKGQA
jgi:3-oxoacyl-[acyl-carrier protein] reductase